MDPSDEEKKRAEAEAKDATAGGDNQLDAESKEELVKKGAVGRRFAVVDIPKEATRGLEAK